MIEKRIQLPMANAYKYPYRGYKWGSVEFYKEIKVNREQWTKFRKILLARQDFKCAYCLCDLHGRRMNVEHVLPLSKGGGNDSKNLVAACSECNRKKGSKRLKKWQMKDLEANLKNLKKASDKHRRTIAKIEKLKPQLEEEYQIQLGNDLRRMFAED